MSWVWDILSGKRIRESRAEAFRFWCIAIGAGEPATAASISSAPRSRVRIRPDGWIRHLGGPFPFDRRLTVQVVLAGGVRMNPEPADRTPEQWWEGRAADPRHDVLFYRIVAPRNRWRS